jgi:hypothetical protein
MLRLHTCNKTTNPGVLATRYSRPSCRLCTVVCVCTEDADGHSEHIRFLRLVSGGVQMMEQRLNKPVWYFMQWLSILCSISSWNDLPSDRCFVYQASKCVLVKLWSWLQFTIFWNNDAMWEVTFKLFRGVSPLYLCAHHFPLKSVG